MVRKYADRVTFFEIGNEWKWFAIDHIEQYSLLLRRTIPVVRAAAPSARIMLGSTSGLDAVSMLGCLRHGLGQLEPIAP